jgi:hypothetical protein
MGTFTKSALDDILASGCACGAKKLNFETYVEGRVPLLGGEQSGSVVWAYKGETFVDGIFEISCAGCKQILFSSDVCPRCNAESALPTVLAAQNRFPIPRACPRCRAQSLTYTAMIPARVVYEGARAQKARPNVVIEEDGFHGCRVDCKACGKVAEVRDVCPLCAAKGPLRARPD